ncbi:AbrB/MazE/SpoVT family DNA-binding domain-containing protein [Sulfurisphaera tokodaii]|uniref:Antitoxin n=2 Tax=Sulfurisphaera tokodaii TaxID=111955 RepID=Q974B2_SULTO|nr:AbrB/MazE/SpoVT family DNA-binding domain-containing protein [Sulfurisphaera tokodaii]BAB65748.1 putative antitoxin [Sulfurisphaera tokodaii str. 7]HII72824.1 AbrB/MazE/SpoVT family DNA-binding domain-containing protein [Sulfurisphaera tokodaii]
MRVKVTRNFQITIPAEVREKLNIREGEYVDVTINEKEGIIIVRPYRKKWTTVTLGKRITQEEIDKAIEEVVDDFTKSFT